MADDGYRTALGRVRGHGAAHEGTGHFVRQRLTALANVPLTIAVVVIVIALTGESHEAVTAALANPLVAAVLLALIVSVAIHMRLGMQVIIEDYVTAPLAKLACLAGNTLFAAGVAILVGLAVLKIAFGG